jgi:hypothetical protein
MPTAPVMPYLLPIVMLLGLLGRNHAAGFALIALGAFFVVQKW